jgi:hypothetical protein
MPNTCGSCAAESDAPGVFTFAAVYRGYRQCRRRKRGTANAQRYEHRLLDHLVDTTRSLQDRGYAPSRSLCFVARQPMAREPAPVTSLRSQVQYFRHQFPPALVLVQIGNRMALFEPDLSLALAPCPWLARWRGAQVETRCGLGQGLSWPLDAIQGLGRSLHAAGLAYAFVAEEGFLRGGMKRRVPRFLYSPLATGPVRFQENAGRQP